MRYITLHHNAYYFQLRVPAALRGRYGEIVRLNLGTNERDIARPLALQLAAYWLTRFSVETLDGTASFDPPAPIAPLVTAVEETMKRDVPRESHISMADAFAYWRGLVAERPERTVIEFSATSDDVDKRLGVGLLQLRRADVARYRDLLLGDGLAPATVTKRIGFVSAMLQTMYDAGKLPDNVARGLRVPRPKVESEGRREFTPDELRTLFASPIYASSKRPRGCGGEAGVWLPVLALVSGARLDELAQLRPADVFATEQGGLLMRIEDGGGKRLKTASSRRIVPVHPAAVEAGFAKYVECRLAATDAWLFPDLRADRFGRSGQFSKWFGHYLRSQRGCGIADRRVVFHSFRHTFKSMCRAAGIAEEVHDALTGHGGGVGRNYGSVPTVALVEAVGRIRLPVHLPTISAV